MQNTGKLTYLFRLLGLMHLLDKIKFLFQKYYFRHDNREFFSKNPDVILPPDYMMFESFQLNFKKYYEGGMESAQWILEKVGRHKRLDGIKLLDWGCGPARITRHIPHILGDKSEVYGTDSNAATVEWCQTNFKNILFSANQISPPLKYGNRLFDVIIGISIFTHLSHPRHMSWVEELHRILCTGGLLFITTHGRAFKVKMTEQEKILFDHHELIVRGNVKEGHRVFAAFHPTEYLKKLIDPYFVIVEHVEGKIVSWGIEQDYWILKKR